MINKFWLRIFSTLMILALAIGMVNVQKVMANEDGTTTVKIEYYYYSCTSGGMIYTVGREFKNETVAQDFRKIYCRTMNDISGREVNLTAEELGKYFTNDENDGSSHKIELGPSDHVYEYKCNNDATHFSDGTETPTCVFCGVRDSDHVRTVEGTMLQGDFNLSYCWLYGPDCTGSGSIDVQDVQFKEGKASEFYNEYAGVLVEMTSSVQSCTLSADKLREYFEAASGWRDEEIPALGHDYVYENNGTAEEHNAPETAICNRCRVTIPCSVVKEPPIAKADLVYTGGNQELISAGTAENGTMYYALGEGGIQPPTEGWGAEIPTGKDTGEYYVWYKSKADAEYFDSRVDSSDRVVVQIGKAQSPEISTGLAGVKPTEYGRSDGKITGTSVAMEYSTDAYFNSPDSIKACTASETANLAAGTYYVRYKETTNYSAGPACKVDVPEGDKNIDTITVTGYTGEYDGEAHGITVSGVPAGATVKYGDTEGTCDRDSLTYTDVTGSAKTVFVKVSKEGYKDWTGSGTVTITKSAPAELTGLAGVKPTEYGMSDGKITGTSVDMEYSTDADFSNPDSIMKCTASETAYLAAGTYYVRYKETTNYSAGPACKVDVPEGDRNFDIKVTNYTGEYDGKAHGITVRVVPEDATVKYGDTEGTYDRDSITYTDVTGSAKTVFVKVSKEGYKDWTGSGTVTITKSAPAGLTGLAGVKPTEYGRSDGRITGTSVDMEYSTDADFSNPDSIMACTASETANLAAGTYYVRYKETTNYSAGQACKVVVPEGDKKVGPIIIISPTAETETEQGSEPAAAPGTTEDQIDGTVENPATKAEIEQKLAQVFTDSKAVVTEQKLESAVTATKKGSAYYDESGKKITNSFVATSDGNFRYVGTTGKSVKKAVVATFDAETDEMKMYYAGKNGVIVKNKVVTLPDGGKIFASEDGTLETNKLVTSGKHQYYAGKDGRLVTDQVIKLEDGTRYFVNRYGYIRKNALITAPDGDKRYATADGTLAKNCWVTIGKKMYWCNKIGRITKSKSVK